MVNRRLLGLNDATVRIDVLVALLDILEWHPDAEQKLILQWLQVGRRIWRIKEMGWKTEDMAWDTQESVITIPDGITVREASDLLYVYAGEKFLGVFSRNVAKGVLEEFLKGIAAPHPDDPTQWSKPKGKEEEETKTP